MIESVLAALKTGRNIHCDEKNINPLKIHYGAVIVPFILIFLPSFLSGTSLPLLNKILGLLPDQMLQMNQVVKFFNLYEIGGKVFCAVPILIISYSILLLLIVPVIYFIYRRKEVYN